VKVYVEFKVEVTSAPSVFARSTPGVANTSQKLLRAAHSWANDRIGSFNWNGVKIVVFEPKIRRAKH
jgi:hypothetical protein